MSTLGTLTPSQLSGSGAPYCSATAFLDYFDIRPYADLLSDTGYRLGGAPNPSANVVISSPRLVRLLTAASGELESACLKGQMYTPTDLATLTTLAIGTITGVSSPTTVTTITVSVAIALTIGQSIVNAGIVGATQANGNFFVTSVPSSTTFIITTTTTSTYVSGGTVAALTLPNSGELVQRIVAGIAAGYLWERRPNKAPEEIIAWAKDKLEALKIGEAVLGTIAQQEAGIPAHHVDSPQEVRDRNLVETIMFPYYGLRGNLRRSRLIGGSGNPLGP